MWYATATIATPAGPIKLAGKADEKVAAYLYGMKTKQAASFARASAAVGALSQVSVQDQAAQRLYLRLRARDPKAQAALRTLYAAAAAGNAKAQEACARVKAAASKVGGAVSIIGGTTTMNAAESLYNRLKAQDPTAWQSVQTLLALAKQGDARAIAAWQTLQDVHAHGGKARVPAHISGGNLSTSEIGVLLSLIQQARWSTPSKALRAPAVAPVPATVMPPVVSRALPPPPSNPAACSQAATLKARPDFLSNPAVRAQYAVAVQQCGHAV